MVREISRDEVSEHCDYSSCWVIIHNEVIDVTKFLDSHPGSAEILLEYAGSDATDAFESCGHSMAARMLSDKYKIGILPEPEQLTFGSQCIAYAKKLVSAISA